ncbi:MAG: KamA family radical SAM protein [Deltaproteobacteria bacterium]|nr:KamA family radical SAM protein [Deltaproteobacteria bacterium]
MSETTTAAAAKSPGAITASPIVHKKPPVDPATLTHRNLRTDEFWRRIPGWKDVDEATFLNHLWQEKHAIISPARLVEAVQSLASPEFIRDVEAGFHKAPMAVRISPYLLSLIDWSDPYRDPIRRQFLPVASQLEPDHPMLTLDSLHEQDDAPVPGLTHRYPDKVLFLVLDTCPVYCRFCTRSYAVGLDTDVVDKVSLKATDDRWERALQYVAERPEVEDVVVSGGDCYRLKPDQIRALGDRLLAMPNIRRFRFATKGIAVQPMKILTDTAWTDAVTEIVDKGKKLHKEVVIHTHFNHPNEITGITQRACDLLMERGITVRNQSVFQRGVNDTGEVMTELVRKLSYVNVHPYYVYIHDLVKGTEDLRTSVATGVQVEKRVRGSTAGYNTPLFLVDAPGGGGKRDMHSYELYDRETGISVYTAPAVKKDQLFCTYDPIAALSPRVQADWHDANKRAQMVNDALAAAKARII